MTLLATDSAEVDRHADEIAHAIEHDTGSVLGTHEKDLIWTAVKYVLEDVSSDCLRTDNAEAPVRPITAPLADPS